MYLTGFKIEGYQSYRTLQEVRFDPKMTVLAGRNNVGKTALLRALRLPASDLSRSQVGMSDTFRIKYTWSIGRDELDNLIEDGSGLLRALGAGDSQTSFELSAAFERAKGTLDGLPVVGADSGYQVVSQVIPMLWLTEVMFVGTQLRMRVYRYEGQAVLWWDRISVGTVGYMVRVVQQIQNLEVSQIGQSYYLHPRRVSPPMPLSVTGSLVPDGSNLTAVVGTLYVNARHGTFQELEGFMRSAFPDISSIDVPIGSQGSGGPIATIHLAFGTAPRALQVPLGDCGTGMEQMLMLATAILTAPTPRLFLIDEPHAFLHPSAERHLLRLIRSHPEHQFVVATHSPVFLNAVGLKQVRLVTLDGDGSHIHDETTVADIFDEVGITAADLWSADAILWVEGPSDRDTLERVAATCDDLNDITFRVVAMPDLVRSASASVHKAASAVKFCESVRQAILPVKVQALFLWDGDEKSDDLKRDISIATDGRSKFLPVRELENLFLLVPEAVHAVLSRLCEQVTRSAPTVEEVETDIQDRVADTSNRMLYKHATAGPDEAKVVGSRVLDALWKKWALADYSKVEYGPQLVDEVLRREPERLEPVRAFLRELAAQVEAERTRT
jgi:predicted ATPase